MSKLNKTYKALYRRNNYGQPCIWAIEVINTNSIQVSHGILGKTITKEIISTGNRSAIDEYNTKFKTKRKNGYLPLNEVTDQVILPVEEVDIIAYLNTYLPTDRQSSTGAMLPQLAKLYDNTNNKLFKDNKVWIAQPKINGLRCLIGAKHKDGDLFNPIKLTFQSREGTYWDSLDNLEEYLLKVLHKELLHLMINENYLLDGELYIPGQFVNDMNSIVKNTKNPLNKEVQFWCYDIAITEMSQFKRHDILDKYLQPYKIIIVTKYSHINNKERLVVLTNTPCNNSDKATIYRDIFISWGFEGLILRDPHSEYQFGKRNLSMIKYKAITDGIFIIKSIRSEGDKRAEIPLLTLINDINDKTFDVHITGTFEYQKDILVNKDKYIWRKVIVEYGERSGVNQLPFHVKTVTLVVDAGESIK